MPKSRVAKAADQQDAADEFEKRDGDAGGAWRGHAEAGEEAGGAVEIVQPAPAGLGELPPPVHADEEEETATPALAEASWKRR